MHILSGAVNPCEGSELSQGVPSTSVLPSGALVRQYSAGTRRIGSQAAQLQPRSDVIPQLRHLQGSSKLADPASDPLSIQVRVAFEERLNVH